MPRLIGLTGFKRSGKNTVARVIASTLAIDGLTSREISFAEPLKRVCHIIFGVPMEWMRDGDKTAPTCVQWEDLPDFYRFHFQGKTGSLNVRELLQIVGTDLFRERFYRHVWIDVARREVRETKQDVAIITDCRFADEAEFIKSVGGEVWAVLGKGGESSDLHSSEKSVSKCIQAADHSIDNHLWDMQSVQFDVVHGLARMLNR